MLSALNVEAELSYAYLHAVASRTGIICECAGRHTDEAGIDVVLRVNGRLANDSTLTCFTVEAQLKATIQEPTLQEGRYPFSLRLKNYNDLRITSTAVPRILVVLFLPRDDKQWLSHSVDGLVSRRCAWWVSLRNAPESSNETAQTVYLPQQNVVSPDALRELMTRFSCEELIDYEP